METHLHLSVGTSQDVHEIAKALKTIANELPKQDAIPFISGDIKKWLFEVVRALDDLDGSLWDHRRAYIAAGCLQAMISSASTNVETVDPTILANQAVQLADALIQKLDEE